MGGVTEPRTQASPATSSPYLSVAHLGLHPFTHIASMHKGSSEPMSHGPCPHERNGESMRTTSEQNDEGLLTSVVKQRSVNIC